MTLGARENIVKIETTRFGTIHVHEEDVITMPYGLLGFPGKRRFCIFRHRKGSPFLWYQSVDDPDLAFVITSPWLFVPDYEIDLGEVVRTLGWAGNTEGVAVDCYVIVTIPKGLPEKMTANLIGPIILNRETNEAVQIVLPNETYTHKYSLVKKKAA